MLPYLGPECLLYQDDALNMNETCADIYRYLFKNKYPPKK